MFAGSATIAAVGIGSYTTVNKVAVKTQESSFNDSADVTDSQSSETPTLFDPQAVSISSSNLLTALSFQEKYGNPSSADDTEEDDGATQNNPPEEGVDGKQLDSGDENSAPEGENIKNPTFLSEQDLAQIQILTLQDSKIRNDKEAQVRVGGQYTSRPQYEYEKGPDNRQYAISGHVEIDARSVAGNPEETIRKLRVVKRAALAPAEPSAEDRKIAANASNGIQQAVGEIRARITVENRQEQAAINRAEDEATRQISRIENSITRDLEEAGRQQPHSQAESETEENSINGEGAGGPNNSHIEQSAIAARALEQAARLLPSASINNNLTIPSSNSPNETVISNKDVSLATITAAPGLFVNAAA